MKHRGKKLLAAVLSAAMLIGMVPTSVSAAENQSGTKGVPTIEQLRNTKAGDYVSTIATPQDNPVINPDYDRSYDNYEITSEEGFLHPGILMNREELNIMRDMVWIGADPWSSAFAELQKSPYASLDYKPDGPFETISSDRETYSLTRTSTAVYEQALMWYITGNKEYADNAIQMMMDWADTMKKDEKEDHLRMGTSTQKFCAAAEIFRYTPSSGWTEENTEKLCAYLERVNPSVDKAFQYYNQGGYAMMAFMAKSIFMDRKADYADAVERLAYNKEGGWKDGFNVNYSLSAMVFNSGQFVEMGRDQEHAWDDLGFMAMAVKQTYVQGTKVDEKGNIVSAGGQDLYEYENQKVLKAAAYWQRYCMGEEPEFIGNQNAWGQKTEFDSLSNDLRGSRLMWFPSLYYHYRYIKGYTEDMSRTILAPTDKDPSVDTFETYGDLYRYTAVGQDLAVDTYVRGINVDFPDFQDLTFTPLAAIMDTPLKGGPQESEGAPDNCDSYNRYTADLFSGTGNGERDSMGGDRRNGGVITEPVEDEEGNAHFATSDLQNGEWVSYNIDFGETFGEGTDTLIYTYGTNATNNPKVDVYVGEWEDEPAQSDYEKAVEDGKIGTVELGPTGGYTSFQSFSGKMDAPEKLTGKKTVYFYCYGSDNGFSFHGNCLWFKFVDSQAHDLNIGSSADITEKAEIGGESLKMSDGAVVCWENMDFDSGFSGLTLDIQAESAGTLKMYVDGPDETNGGKLIRTFEIDKTDGEITFSQEDEKAVVGRHALYFVYEGEGLTLNSFTFQAARAKTDVFEEHAAGDYTAMITGKTEKTENNGLIMEADTNPYVTYMGIPFHSGADTLAVRVKSTGGTTLYFDKAATDPSEEGQVGRGGNLALFELPDTTELSEDGFVNFYFDLKETGNDTLTGEVLVGMGVSGEGTVEVEYFRLNPENTAPTLALYPKGEEEAADKEIYLQAGTEQIYTVSASDPDEKDHPEISVYGDLPEKIVYEDGSLSVAGDIEAGDYIVQFMVTDGTVNCIETYLFHIQGGKDEVEKIIDDSGIEEKMMTLYIYDKARYTAYTEAKNAALTAPEDEQNVENLKKVIADCEDNMPVYTKVRFEYRLPNDGSTDVISMYLDTTEKDDASLIASTEDLKKQNNVTMTDWIPFENAQGEKIRVSGNHQIAIWLDSAQIRLISFTLSNEDETVTKTIDAVTLTDLGKPNNFCINTVSGGTFPHEVRGAASWLLYTWPNPDDYSDLPVEGNYKGWPLRGNTGPGFDFELEPAIVGALEKADERLDEEGYYTADSWAEFEEAYEAAKAAAEDYAGYDLTHEKSEQLAANLNNAMSALRESNAQITVEQDPENQEIMGFDPTGNTDESGSNKSMNPTITAKVGKTVSFLLKTDEAMKDVRVSVKEFGYRGSRGTTSEELMSVEPKLSTGQIKITEAGESLYKVEWTGTVPGNYRAVFEAVSGDNRAEKAVEIIYRNETERTDFAPDYVRMRFAGFRNNEEKNVDLYLVKPGEEASDNNKIATLSSTWEKDAQYTLTEWTKIQWPKDYDPESEYSLVVKVLQRNTTIDFIEFATESYHMLYDSSYQEYPLAYAGVMRIEAEHYDSNTMKDFDAVDFNGRFGWENGSPGEGAGSIGTNSSVKQLTAEYEGIRLAGPAEEGTDGAVTVNIGSVYMMKGENQKAETVTEPEDLGAIYYSSSVPSVAVVYADGVIEARAWGKTEITAAAASALSDPVTIYVADPDYLQKLTDLYDEEIRESADAYKTESWNQITGAYNAALDALAVNDAQAVYEATEALKGAMDTAEKAARTGALDAVLTVARALEQGCYTEESWAVLAAAVENAEQVNKDSAQDVVNNAVVELQYAIDGLEILVPESVDKSLLAEAVEKAEAVYAAGQDGYTEESWNTFVQALDSAKAVLNNEDAGQAQVDTARVLLEQAIEDLTHIQLDYAELQELYDRYADLSPEGYTEESYRALQSALEQAAALLENGADSQQQVDDAATALRSAAESLESAVDKSALQQKYEEYVRLEQGNYTDDSWAAFEKALDQAAAVLNDAAADQNTVDNALRVLEDARNYLTEKVSSGETENTENPAEIDEAHEGDAPGGSSSEKEELQKDRNSTASTVQTGDTNSPAGLAVVLSIAGLTTVIDIIFIRRKKKNR